MRSTIGLRCGLVLLLVTGFSVLCSAQTRTAYTGAMQAVKGLEGDFQQFIMLVHPVKGLRYRESGRDVNREKPFSRAQLIAAGRKGARKYPVTASYADSEQDSMVNIMRYLQLVAREYRFSSRKDVRRNITGVAHSSDIFRPAGKGETMISFHYTDPSPDGELGWQVLAVRMEPWKGNMYVVGIDYLYWTP